ncbi:unnamed protein product [Trifolium pratense]|uniref:Uncharacterized protein n=1 Tax=Trifolium pratense TaxID=57577 RepID=A0ACB0L0V7_TRIPR|nr:unnamed protein product [Trifolium pratense]
MVLEIGPRIIDQVFQDTLEERAKAAEDEVRNTREELRQAELKRQKEVQQSEQRVADFPRQLIMLTNSVAAIQVMMRMSPRMDPRMIK